jgi:hypothetical protein
MSHSLLSADRRTYFRMLVVALVAVGVLVAIGLGAKGPSDERGNAVAVIKAGQPATFAEDDRKIPQ